jgi:tetratricopeptide (TPR) repeat protein
LSGVRAEPPSAETAEQLGAPLFADLGAHTRPISTRVPLAQRYFNQGLVLAYGFNHREAARSLREAARLDPECASCWWGVALVLGPNINLPMLPSDAPEAYAAAQKALALSERATPVEQALIRALSQRYAMPPPVDRAPLDRAYADAMRAIAQQNPDDPDVLALYAEAVLDTSPWNYWATPEQPKPGFGEAIGALERAIDVEPDHPGALHYYIHAVEASAKPERALPAADRLRALGLGTGHLIHMPSHIYIRTGRYHDAVLANLIAGKADDEYVAQCNVQGFYPVVYHPHNWHFTWAGSTFEGNRKLALESAEKPHHLMENQSAADPLLGSVVQHFRLTPLFAQARFAQWDAILAAPEPEAETPYMLAIWHHARGLALGARNDLNGARRELSALQAIVRSGELRAIGISPNNNAQQVAEVAERVLAGDVAWRSSDPGAAIAAFREGVALEDRLGYNEPEDWYYPVRLLLGAVLLEAKRPAEAEAAYREDLAKHPENGWALFGLAQSLTAQKKDEEASDARRRFRAAWRHSDVELTASVVR